MGMSVSAQLTLLQQVGQWLLRDEVLAIVVLEDLPIQFFPPLFRKAYNGRKTNMKAMVAAWPFHCFPIETLM